jgi:hypothetical protein
MQCIHEIYDIHVAQTMLVGISDKAGNAGKNFVGYILWAYLLSSLPAIFKHDILPHSKCILRPVGLPVK